MSTRLNVTLRSLPHNLRLQAAQLESVGVSFHRSRSPQDGPLFLMTWWELSDPRMGHTISSSGTFHTLSEAVEDANAFLLATAVDRLIAEDPAPPRNVAVRAVPEFRSPFDGTGYVDDSESTQYDDRLDASRYYGGTC